MTQWLAHSAKSKNLMKKKEDRERKEKRRKTEEDE